MVTGLFEDGRFDLSQIYTRVFRIGRLSIWKVFGLEILAHTSIVQSDRLQKVKYRCVDLRKGQI